MSEIVLKQLALENFCAIESLTLDLDNRGLLLIEGRNEDDSSAKSNGAGKSSIVDGIEWVLFGETARGISGDDVVNRVVGKNCCGLVVFTDGADTYSVCRYRKHKTGKNRLHLTHNGADITKGTDKLTQDALEKILGCTREVFIASIYAGQERMPNLPAMTDKELKTLIEEAAGTRVLERAYEIARERAGVAKRELAAATATLQHAERVVDTAQSNALAIEESCDMWRGKQDAKIAAARAELAAKVKEATAARDRANAFDEAAINAEIRRAQDGLTASSKPIPEEAQLNAANTKLASINAEIRLKNGERTRCQSHIDSLDHAVGTNCGECGKTYEVGDLSAAKNASQAALDRVEVDLRALLDKRKAAIALVEDLQSKVDAARSARSDTATLIAALNAANARARERENALAALRQHIDTSKTLKTRLSELESETNPHIDALARAKAQVDQALRERESAATRLAAQTEQSLVAEESVKVFAPNGIRGEIIDVVTPFLNDRTSAYLGTLSDGNISATWNTIAETGKGDLREKFHIAVDNRNGAGSFEGLSGGERRKVRIATALALQDLVASRAYKPIKLFVGDELDDALDTAGLERLMTVLEEKARAVGSVLIISHNDIGDWVRNHVTIVKKGGMSRLEEKV